MSAAAADPLGVAGTAAIADNETMKRILAFALFAASAAGCDGSGTFTPGGADAGPGPDPNTVTLDEIGVPCSYDPTDPAHPNPTNECAEGLQCLIVTSEAPPVYDSGLGLSAWEDQFTVYNSDPRVDVGYCTLKSDNLAQLPCPAGSVLKVLSPNITVCLRQCTEPADCGRADFVCDERYYDTPGGLCVHQCKVDVPDCIRSGVIQNPQQAGQLIPALAFSDLTGDRQCDAQQGVCVDVGNVRGHAGPGEACFATQDCETGSVCFQAPLLEAVLPAGSPIDSGGAGFCASPCKPGPSDPNNPACSPAYVCQSVGTLNLGFRDPANGVPGPIIIDLATGAIDTRGGFCFHQCDTGLNAACDPFPGTTCGSLAEARVDDTWNTTSMCLPAAIAN